MKKFTKIALNENVEAFVMSVTSFSLNLILIHLVQEVQIAFLFAKEVKITIVLPFGLVRIVSRYTQ